LGSNEIENGTWERPVDGKKGDHKESCPDNEGRRGKERQGSPRAKSHTKRKLSSWVHEEKLSSWEKKKRNTDGKSGKKDHKDVSIENEKGAGRAEEKGLSVVV